MKLHDLRAPKGANKNRKRLGRGPSSGQGKTGGHGHKGQKARAGGKVRPGFEGGQMPLQRRLPKFGFTNIFRKEYNEINLYRFAEWDADSVTIDGLMEKGYIRQVKDGVKILGKGEISKALTFEVTAITASARRKIEAAGGKVVLPVGDAEPEATTQEAPKAATETTETE